MAFCSDGGSVRSRGGRKKLDWPQSKDDILFAFPYPPKHLIFSYDASGWLALSFLRF